MMRNLKCPHDGMHFRLGTSTCNEHAEIPRLKNRAEETVVATWVGLNHVPVFKIAKGS